VGIYGLIIDLGTLINYFGLGGAIIGFLASPLIVAVIPIYYLFKGYWFPALVIYGGGIIASILIHKNEPS
jgi:predicted ABC-type sugar transport system permease subunit